MVELPNGLRFVNAASNRKAKPTRKAAERDASLLRALLPRVIDARAALEDKLRAREMAVSSEGGDPSAAPPPSLLTPLAASPSILPARLASASSTLPRPPSPSLSSLPPAASSLSLAPPPPAPPRAARTGGVAVYHPSASCLPNPHHEEASHEAQEMEGYGGLDECLFRCIESALVVASTPTGKGTSTGGDSHFRSFASLVVADLVALFSDPIRLPALTSFIKHCQLNLPSLSHQEEASGRVASPPASPPPRLVSPRLAPPCLPSLPSAPLRSSALRSPPVSSPLCASLPSAP